MKEKIIIFVIGVLFGAVISTGAFYLYTKSTNNCNCSNQNTQMNGGQPPEMPNGEKPEGEPPEKPDGENGQEPPEKQNDDTNQKDSSKNTASDTTESN